MGGRREWSHRERPCLPRLALAPGGRCILSADYLPNCVKPENVKAMGRALIAHGFHARMAGRPAAMVLPIDNQ